jgi:hypothetical protein
MTTAVLAHDRIKDFDWAPSYVPGSTRYPTKFKIPGKTKDPFRTLVREYLSMEQEKDERQYGALEDVLSRTGAAARSDRGWMEALKLVLPMLVYAEYGAMKNMAQLVETVDNPELRQGYLTQALDEQRHVNQELYLLRHFARHAEDSEGFDRGMRVRGSNVFGRASRCCFENYFVNDPIESAITLSVVTETAYTNPLFVPLTEVAAFNGDDVTPGVFLSIQSDEARHMANGYSTLAAVLSVDENLPLAQEAFDRAFWCQHAFLDPLLGALYMYFTPQRINYVEKWQEWIVDDWVSGYIAKLERFGLKIPKHFAHAAERLQWLPHTAAMVGAATWPFHWWRFPGLDERGMEWMEQQFPGWHAIYGSFWEGYRALQDPKAGMIPFQAFPAPPPLCRVCAMPTVFPHPGAPTARVVEHAGRLHAFCSQPCQEIFDNCPERYLQMRAFDEIFDGWGLDEYIVKNGLLRADGRTLVAQPHVDDTKPMWTIDDIAKLGVEIVDPLRVLAAQNAGAADDSAAPTDGSEG